MLLNEKIALESILGENLVSSSENARHFVIKINNKLNKEPLFMHLFVPSYSLYYYQVFYLLKNKKDIKTKKKERKKKTYKERKKEKKHTKKERKKERNTKKERKQENKKVINK